MEYRILIVDKNRDLSMSFLSLIEKIADVCYIKNWHDALRYVSLFCFHLIILVDICDKDILIKMIETIRILKKAPILIMTSRKLEEELYIEVGADMILPIDCRKEDVRLQIVALMRRYVEREFDSDKEGDVIQIGSLFINFLERKIFWDENEMRFTKHEFDFIYLLASSQERVYTFSQIYQIVWGDYPQGNIVNMIRCMIRRIKKKLKTVDSKVPEMFHNVRDVGYFFKLDITDI